MNNYHPENLLLLAKQKNQEDVDNCLAWKLSYGFSTRRFLYSLGAWMVNRGKKMQDRYAVPLQTNELRFLQDKARKARA